MGFDSAGRSLEIGQFRREGRAVRLELRQVEGVQLKFPHVHLEVCKLIVDVFLQRLQFRWNVKINLIRIELWVGAEDRVGFTLNNEIRRPTAMIVQLDLEPFRDLAFYIDQISLTLFPRLNASACDLDLAGGID